MANSGPTRAELDVRWSKPLGECVARAMERTSASHCQACHRHFRCAPLEYASLRNGPSGVIVGPLRGQMSKTSKRTPSCHWLVPNSAERCHVPADLGELLAKSGQHRPKFGRVRQVWPTSVKTGPTLAKLSPNSAKFDPPSPDTFATIRWKVCPSWPNPVLISPSLAKVWPTPANVGRSRWKLARIWPKLAHTWPTSRRI